MKPYLDQSFYHYIAETDWEQTEAEIQNKTERDVKQALYQNDVGLEGFKALISPAAEPYLEEMAQRSHQLTQKRFGKTIQMYIPLYLSNECHNICTYCGFSMNIPILRKTLTLEEIKKEAIAIRKMGYQHILLVTGEANNSVHTPYFLEAIKILSRYFDQISMEVQPLLTSDYDTLSAQGLHSVLVYQETYRESTYRSHHPKGKKSNYRYRIETPDRIGIAGVHKIGLGVLIGLEEWRTDSLFCAMHLSYLEKKYWQTRYSISFPRLRPCAGGVELTSVMTDRQLIQLICAYRIFNPEVELSLSTREAETFRDHSIKLGITSLSAESKTNPGGYALPEEKSLEQFEISDMRTTQQVVDAIKSQGYDPVWKDWDKQW